MDLIACDKVVATRKAQVQTTFNSDRCATDIEDFAILDDISESGQGYATPATVGYSARIDCDARHYLLRGNTDGVSLRAKHSNELMIRWRVFLGVGTACAAPVMTVDRVCCHEIPWKVRWLVPFSSTTRLLAAETYAPAFPSAGGQVPAGGWK